MAKIEPIQNVFNFLTRSMKSKKNSKKQHYIDIPLDEMKSGTTFTKVKSNPGGNRGGSNFRTIISHCRSRIRIVVREKVDSVSCFFLKSFFVVQNFNIALNKVDFIGAISFL